MTYRTAAAVLALLGFAADNRASAQPLAPQRPRGTAFQNLFYPNSQAVPNVVPGMGFNRGGVLAGPNQLGPGCAGPQGLTLPGGQGNGNLSPFVLIPLQSQPVVFNNRGH